MSPRPPKTPVRTRVWPLEEVSQYHSPVDGRQMVMSDLVSPSTSVNSGTSSPPPPKRRWPKAPVDVHQNHVPVDGRYTVRSARPSPSKSERNGWSPSPPNLTLWCAV